MLSTLVKLRNFPILTSFYKKRLLGPYENCSCVDCLKTFTTNQSIWARGHKKSLSIKQVDESYHYEEENEPKDFGKIIGLSPEEIEIDDSYDLPAKEEVKNFKKKKRSSGKIGLNNNPNDPTTVSNNSKYVVKDGLTYMDLTTDSVKLSSSISNLKSKKLRKRKQQIFLEGKRLISEALSAGCKPISIFFSRVEDIKHMNLPNNVSLYKTKYKNIQLWSDVVTSQGVIGIFKMPVIRFQSNDARTIPLIVICDNIREPGNLGAILRVIAGVGCEKVILTKGCVDIWESKVLRAAAGSHFRIPIMSNLTWTDVRSEIEDVDRIVLADNVLSRPETASVNDSDSETKNAFEIRSQTNETGLPRDYYTSLDYCTGKIVIVIGGETHGLSEDAYALARERNGIRVNIPMCNNVESLNTSVALGILCYEVRRQWDLFYKKAEYVKNESEETVATEISSL